MVGSRPNGPSNPKVLVDASNLHVGGGVQVAASLVEHLVTDGEFPWTRNARFLVSSQVAANLPPAIVSLGSVAIEDSGPRTWRRWMPTRRGYDISFVVFGPEYGWPRARTRIVGFADVRSVFPFPSGMRESVRRKLLMSVRGYVSRALTRRADLLVVESPALQRQLHSRKVMDRSQVRVISNSHHDMFSHPDQWTAAKLPKRTPGEFLLCYVARAYQHKNHEFLPRVAEEARRLGLELRFVLTLTEHEWETGSPELRACSYNVGAVSISQVPSIYRASDGAIFPSLLESFSATPLEAMKMGVPLFASDRDFVKDVCGDGAAYIDPLDAASTARTIADLLGDPSARTRLTSRATEIVRQLPSAKERARATAELIQDQLQRATGRSSHHDF